MRKNRPEMCAQLSSMGLTKKYKPYQEDENDVVMLEVRHPVKITDGIMKGVSIDIHDDDTIRVWTSQKKKANDIATKNRFRIRLLDGEAELYLPASRADEFLHSLGAKVKQNRVMSPEQRAEVAARFAKARKTALAART